MSFHGEHIWIIGASSGIGEALARELSTQGATLILSARREAELQALKDELGKQHHVVVLDVSDADAVSDAANKVRQMVEQIDRTIFMAAIFKPTDIDAMDMAFAKQMVEVNLMGAIYLTYAILPILHAQKGGQLVLCSSIAGYTGLPGGQPYCATKAALTSFAESLYAEVEEGIDIKLISPGFVRTRITDKNDFPMPMMIEPERAAKAIARGLKGRAFEIHFPKAFTYATKFLQVLPYWLKLWITRHWLAKM